MTADRPPPSRRAIVATAIAALTVAIAVIVSNAPANWLALYVARETGGVVLLADAQGTIWSGSAVVALAAPRAAGPGEGGPDGLRLALPGRVIWTLEMTRALAPVLHLTHDGVLPTPLAIRFVDGGPTFDPGAATLPASMLRLVGAPMNTLSPEGRCTLQWTAFRVGRDGAAVGEGTLRIDGLALALSPVRPLGDYLLTWSSGARGLAWQLATQRGPLLLEGNGTVVDDRVTARVVVRPAPDAPAGDVARLGLLLDMIGRHSANEAVIEVGGR